MTPWQRGWIFVRAVWWAKPTVLDVIEHIQMLTVNWLLRLLYKAHWL